MTGNTIKMFISASFEAIHLRFSYDQMPFYILILNQLYDPYTCIRIICSKVALYKDRNVKNVFKFVR